MLGLFKYYRSEKQADLALSQWDDEYFQKDPDLIYISVIKSRKWWYHFELEFARKGGKNDRLGIPVDIPEYLPIRNKNLTSVSSSKELKIKTRIIDADDVSNIDENKSVDFMYDPVIQGGKSVSNYPRRYGGTLGCVFYLKGIEGMFGVSNHHVLQDNNSERIDDIFNPRVKGLTNNDLESARSGYLVWDKFKPFIDAAFYRIEDEDRVKSGLKNGDHLCGLNRRPKRGLKIKKTGFKTNDTTGIIRSRNTTVRVSVHGVKSLFKKQIQSSKISNSGDSGSIVYDCNKHVVGLLFADDKRSDDGFSYINNINYLFNYKFETTEYLHLPKGKIPFEKFEIESFV